MLITYALLGLGIGALVLLCWLWWRIDAPLRREYEQTVPRDKRL